MKLQDTGWSLHGQTVLITGASSGIGRSLALELAAAGAAVALCARRVERLEELAISIRASGGKAVAVPMDVTQEESVRRGFGLAEAALGPLKGLVANSGINRSGAAVELSGAAFDEIMAVNLKGAFLTARELVRRLRPDDRAGSGGRIVLVASIGGVKPLPGAATYCASKAGLVMMGRALAQEWICDDVNVNVVCPGYIATELNAHLFEGEEGQRRMSRFPRRRLMEAGALSPVVGFLLSPQAQMCTGGVFTIDDGQTLADENLHGVLASFRSTMRA